MACTSVSGHHSHTPRSTAVSEDSTDDWLRLIRAEYLEMPGLHLTRGQAQRLWNLDTRTCDALLNALVRMGFLRQTNQGAYVRADS
jgi:DNA-binding IclR family transcriptional regulator